MKPREATALQRVVSILTVGGIGLALAGCNSATTTSGSAPSSANAVASVAGTSLDWQPRGNKSSDSTISEAAVRLWESTASGAKLEAGEKVLYAGDADLAGIPDGECGVVALAGRTTGGEILIGWFSSFGALTSSNLIYLGETTASTSQSEEGIATDGVCPGEKVPTAIALAAPGSEVAPPTPLDLAPGEYGPRSALALWNYKAGSDVTAAIISDGKFHSTFEITPQPQP